jgi:hypothetical protein
VVVNDENKYNENDERKKNGIHFIEGNERFQVKKQRSVMTMFTA